MWKPNSAKREQCPGALQYLAPVLFSHTVVLAQSDQNACRLVLYCHVLASTEHASMTHLFAHRADWNREKAMHSNYANNQFQSDPNEGFGRNAAPKKVSGHTGSLRLLMPKMAAAACLLRIILQMLFFFVSTRGCLSTLSRRHAEAADTNSRAADSWAVPGAVCSGGGCGGCCSRSRKR